MQSEEIWKDIPGYKGYYQASNLGRIRSLKFWSNSSKKHYDRIKVLKPKPSSKLSSHSGKVGTGYRVDLHKDGDVKSYLVARLVAFTFLGFPPDESYTVEHKNGNRLDNKVENLEWMTRGDNIRAGFKNNLYTYQKAVYIIDKTSGEKTLYRSMSLASRAMEKNVGYLSCAISRGRTENDRYRWELKDNSLGW
jgi:hypothetical protein